MPQLKINLGTFVLTVHFDKAFKDDIIFKNPEYSNDWQPTTQSLETFGESIMKQETEACQAMAKNVFC